MKAYFRAPFICPKCGMVLMYLPWEDPLQRDRLKCITPECDPNTYLTPCIELELVPECQPAAPFSET